MAVRAALVSGNRKVYELLLQEGKENSRLEDLKKRAKLLDIPIRRVSEADMTTLAEGSSHGGVMAVVSERSFLPLDDLINGPQAAFLVMLDGVEDPYNFGQAVRAIYACGAHGLILRPRNWTSAATTVARASAGSSEFMRMAIVESDEQLLSMVKRQKLNLICSDLAANAQTPAETNLREPLLLVIGGEKRGISKTLLASAHSILQIPYGRNFKQSLGVTSSAAILAYEVMQQRRKLPGKKSGQEKVVKHFSIRKYV